jgi:hypothetical protein
MSLRRGMPLIAETSFLPGSILAQDNPLELESDPTDPGKTPLPAFRSSKGSRSNIGAEGRRRRLSKSRNTASFLSNANSDYSASRNSDSVLSKSTSNRSVRTSTSAYHSEESLMNGSCQELHNESSQQDSQEKGNSRFGHFFTL